MVVGCFYIVKIKVICRYSNKDLLIEKIVKMKRAMTQLDMARLNL
tara:strand:- start:56657 stop:56791 length:135 start_codon:yes stop_codon:yes gene_type:complete